ncbi:MAG: CsbD family protein [Chloroflexota bacterium]
MNKDVLEGKWMQLKGKVKQQWGKLTDDELDKMSGRYDELAGIIQERYGYSREEAANELDMFLTKLDTPDMK